MPHIRKAQAGNDSFGNSWDKDGAVVDVPHEQAEQLLAIDDGQFTLADAPDDEPEPVVSPEFSEVVPAAPEVEPAADSGPSDAPAPVVDVKPAPAAKKAAARKTAASKPQD